MRTNFPQPDRPADLPPHNATELSGAHLKAMQDISSLLMDKLPANDFLWQTLAQAEALLIEAQMKDIAPRDVFGAGGVAAFCQSIVDEYHAHHQSGELGNKDVPASRDRSIRKDEHPHGPRGVRNSRRKRRTTIAMISAFSLAFVLLACWYVGLIRYVTNHTGFYLDELHNFENTVTAINTAPFSATLPLRQDSDLHVEVYTAPTGESIRLTTMIAEEHDVYINDNAIETTFDGSTQVKKKTFIKWKIRFTYSIKTSFTEISYVEPGSNGTATVTLADGTEHTFTLRGDSSGTLDEGYEYIYITAADLEKDIDTTGATIRIELEPPHYVVWKRTGLGGR